MSRHPQSDEWMRLLDGEVTTNREAALREHADACAPCRREVERLESLLSPLRDPISTPQPGATERVIAALGRDEAPSAAGARRRRVIAGGVAALAAAAGLLFAFLPRGEPAGGEGTFQARGGGGESEPIARRAGVRFHVLPGPSALEEGEALAPDEALFASYTNRTGGPVYALVFAVDARGTVHWLYPGYTDPATDPGAVRLGAGERDRAFDESVVLEAPAPGEMLLVSILGRERRAVSAVESIPKDARTLAGLRDRFPEATVRAVRVEVRP